MRENVKSTICISLFFIFASGCAQTIENPTETPTPTATIVPTLTNTPTPSPEPTTTYIYKPPPSEVPTTPPESVLNSNITIAAREDSNSKKLKAVLFIISYYSKNLGENSEKLHQYELFIQNEFDSTLWVVDSIDGNINMGNKLPWPIAWSENEKFLYFTHKPINWDGCDNYKITNGSNLIRFDVETGIKVEIFPKVGNWVALSPKQEYFGVISSFRKSIEKGKSPPNIILYNMLNGEQKSVTALDIEEDNFIGQYFYTNLIWSKNGEQLAYIIRTNICAALPNEVFSSLILIDIKTLEQEILFLKEQNNFMPISWFDNEIIILEELFTGTFWHYNTSTGAFSPEN